MLENIKKHTNIDEFKEIKKLLKLTDKNLNDLNFGYEEFINLMSFFLKFNHQKRKELRELKKEAERIFNSENLIINHMVQNSELNEVEVKKFLAQEGIF